MGGSRGCGAVLHQAQKMGTELQRMLMVVPSMERSAMG